MKLVAETRGLLWAVSAWLNGAASEKNNKNTQEVEGLAGGSHQSGAVRTHEEEL